MRRTAARVAPRGDRISRVSSRRQEHKQYLPLVWFLGRRSLLYKVDSDSTSLHFSSVADASDGPWQEVEADAIYQLSFEMGAGWESRNSTEGLLSTSVVSICQHLWENLTPDRSVRTPTQISDMYRALEPSSPGGF